MSTQSEHDHPQSDYTPGHVSCCQSDHMPCVDSELWQALQQYMMTPAECVVLIESFVYGFTPRAIRDRHPQLFPDLRTIYRIKLAVFDYLRGHPGLSQLFDLNP
jgi:hypothetical protein